MGTYPDALRDVEAGAIFLPGKRSNMVFLLYQLTLYPLLAILGIMGAREYGRCEERNLHCHRNR